MKVISVENKNKEVSYVKSAAIGGVTGYALKYALPLQEFEQKEVLGDSFKLKKVGAMYRARLQEYNAIDKAIANGSESVSAEAASFLRANKTGILKTSQNRQGFDEKLKALSDVARSQINGLMGRIESKGIEKGNFLQGSAVAYAKRSRPAFYYIAIGMAISLCLATLRNYFSAKKPNADGISIII